MIEIPNSNAGAGPSPSGAPAAPGGGGPSAAAAGDATVGTANAPMLEEIRAFAAGVNQQDAKTFLQWELTAGRISKGQHDAILAGSEPAAPAAISTAPGSATPAMLAETAAFIGGLGPHEAQRWLDGDVKSGLLSRSQADKILAGRAAPVDSSGSNVTPESVAALTAAAQAAEIDAAFPPAKAGQFDMPVFTDEHGRTDSKGAFDAAAGARAALETAGFTREIGGYLAKEIASVQKEWTGLDETGQEIYRRGQMAQLERMWNEKTPEKIALAQQLVRELEAKHPGVMDLLDATGAANSAAVIAQVVAHAERLLAKRGLSALPK